jgi:hypothetical protein
MYILLLIRLGLLQIFTEVTETKKLDRDREFDEAFLFKLDCLVRNNIWAVLFIYIKINRLWSFNRS